MAKMVHLVVGASGQVGAALVRELKKSDSWEVIGTFWSNPNTGTAKYFMDVSDKSNVDNFIGTLSPSVVWIPAYFTNVDYADKAKNINIDGMKNVIRASESVGAKIVFFSSGYVFDGDGKLPYKTSDTPNPINEYGKQKLEIEKLVLENPKNVVIRTMGVYGIEDKRKNFAYRVLDTVSAHQRIYVPADQWMNPILADDLAEISVDLVTLFVTGLVHVAGNMPVTKYQFAMDLVREAHLNTYLVIPKTSEQMNQSADRPKWAVLDWTEIEQWGSQVRDYKESIKEFVRIY